MKRLHLVVPAAVADTARPSGGNVFDRSLAIALTARGWRVGETRLAGPWPCPGRRDLEELAHVLAELPEGDPVLVDGLIASAAPGALTRRARRGRLLVVVHLPLGVGARSGTVSQREGDALRAADGVVVTSRWTRGWLVSAYRLPLDRVHLAEPGVAPAGPAAAQSAGVSLACVGPLSPIKGQDLLVAALEQVADLPWTCRMVGSREVEPRFARGVAHQVRRAGLTDRISFTDPLPADTLWSALSSTELVLQSSRMETYGMVLAEALARGIPVLATDVGGVREAVGCTPDGSLPGLLVPCDSEHLAAALRLWLEDDHLRRGLQAAAGARRHLARPWSRVAHDVERVLVGNGG